MGTDIRGWVEFWDPTPERWVGLIKLDSLLSDRNYEMFAWLFGIRRRPDILVREDFGPVAAERGLPPDVSHEAIAEYQDAIARFSNGLHGASWVTWRELQAITWDEPIEDMIIERRRDQQQGGISSWRSQFLRERADAISGRAEALRPGERWTAGDKTYEVVAMRRHDALGARWELLLRLMELLATHRGGAERVRIVVWFVD